ncbi:hypothetical protein C922_05057 [Plasmodium inui San Antonio 1]|uniref:Uncharacterized protein n=1 Tax=Plasmodium inui San Antonio 1 TaxID=1237626 RepID=W7AGZ8_9APIC|nr:hypothetical protein C922_05057 [Plasmodium inui San Antonio 1]EUD64541.1 hypothetical protein C922_05057 [Plasmodium inui San Antonio 1]
MLPSTSIKLEGMFKPQAPREGSSRLSPPSPSYLKVPSLHPTDLAPKDNLYRFLGKRSIR